MAKRFYISDYMGDGLTEATAWYPRILTLQESPPLLWVEGRAIANVNGHCLVYTDNTDDEHAAVIAHPNVKYVPFEDAAGNVLALADTAGDVAPAKRAAILDFLEARHIPTHGVTPQTTLHEIVTSVIKRYMLRGNLRGMDLTDGLDTNISAIQLQQRQAIAAQLQSKGFDTSVLSGTVRQGLRALMDQDVKAMRFSF